MNGRRMTDRHLSQALRAHLPERAQAGLRQRIVDAVETTPQLRPLPSVLGRAIALRGLDPSTGRVRANRWTLVLVAAAVLTLIVASAIFIGRQRPTLLAINPPPTSTPTSTATSTPTSTTTPTPTAEVSPSPVALSPVLTWTKVALDGRSPQIAWLGDRFVLADRDTGAVRISTDGTSWQVLPPGDPDPGYAELLKGSFASWQDHLVGWWNPEDGPDIAGKPPITARDIVRIVRPPAEPTVTTPWKGRIESIGIGPKGIVAQVHSDLDWDAWVTKKLGARSNNAWVTHLKGVDFRDGILQIKLDNGPGLKVVWADEGFALGDYQDAGFEWYSPDGKQWQAVPLGAPWTNGDSGPGFPTGFGAVVGVSDGFIAQGDTPEDSCPLPAGCGDMWHSSDGLTWRNLGKPTVDSPDGPVLPWNGGALVTDGIGRFAYWTSSGYSELPLGAHLASPERQNVTVGTGPLGLVSVQRDDQKILVTRDGVDWDLGPMPAEMAAASGDRRAQTVAVGERSVLVLLWSGSYEKGYVPSLWRGTPEP